MPMTKMVCTHPRRALRRALALALLVAATLPFATRPSAADMLPAEAISAESTAAATATTTAPSPATGTTAPAASAATVPADADGNALVCKRVRETGSNIGRRVCKTRAQLAAESEAARSMLEQRNRMTNSAGAGEDG